MSYIDLVEVEHFVDNSILYKGYRQSSLKSLRDSQDQDLTSKLVRLSSQYLYFRNLNKLKEPNFFAGAVDFIIGDREGKRKFYAVDAQGASGSNFSSLPKMFWQMANDSILESLLFTKSRNPLVLIAHPNEDEAYYEKYCLAQNLRQIFLSKGFDKCALVGVEEVARKENLKNPVIALGSYDDILPKLTVSSDRVYFDSNPIDMLVGSEVLSHLKRDKQRSTLIDSKTVIINALCGITEDRFLIYRAADAISEQLATFDVEPIKWRVGKDFNETVKVVEEALEEFANIVLTPHGGGSRHAAELISKTEDVRGKLNVSLRSFAKNDVLKADPYPYTISKAIETSSSGWQEVGIPCDVRVFIGRSGSRILPLGAVLRVKDGRADERRSTGGSRFAGINKETLLQIGLKEMDIADIFSAAAHLIAFMGNNLDEIVGKTVTGNG